MPSSQSAYWEKTCSISGKENEDLVVDQQTGWGRKGCAQKNTAKLYLHIGYQAEETGRIAHERNLPSGCLANTSPGHIFFMATEITHHLECRPMMYALRAASWSACGVHGRVTVTSTGRVLCVYLWADTHHTTLCGGTEIEISVPAL